MALSIATYNVKDLFDPLDGAPSGHHGRKLANVARLVSRLDADVLGFQEVGSEACVLAVLALATVAPAAAHVIGTADHRGIRNAVVTRMRPLATTVHTTESVAFPVFVAGDPPPFGKRLPLRRGVVHVRVEAGDLGPVDVLCCHFKSQRPAPLRDANGQGLEPRTQRERAEGELRSLVWRAAEALHVRGLVDAILAADPAAKVAVIGDLNALPDAVPVRILCGEGEGRLIPCAELIPPERRYSILHEGARQQIDHILVTASLHARLVSAELLNAELRDHGSFKDAAEPPDDSDHAPLIARFA